MNDTNKTPIEVQLVEDVRKCRTCQWFWGGTPPYGNFPVFDWNEDYPEEIRNQHQTLEDVTKPALIGKAVGQGQVDPGIMHGCRKAPIMTVGINPNMTSYFPSSAGARWSYPNLSEDKRYAYYYRHHNVYQESLDLEFIKANVVDGTGIIAEHDGWLLSSSRSSDHRWLLLTIQYVDQEQPQEIEVAWTDSERFVVFVDRSYRTDPDKLGFKAGDLIGGKISSLSQDNVQIYENSTGYYQRFVYVLEQFKKLAGGALSDADLSISEDVAQHDMIGCASPGWSDAYDIPTAKITTNCVIDNAYLLKQLVQSKPAVIVIVGGSSLEMFAQLFAPFMPDFNYYYESKDSRGKVSRVIKETYQLLKETTERENYLEIKSDGFHLKSRLIVTPHFSYSDNFQTQSRLTEAAWQAFSNDFRDDAQILAKQKRIEDNTWNNIVPIIIDGPDDEIKKLLSANAWQVLMAYYYDPILMMAEVLNQEYSAGRISYDEKINRLKRADGGCQFCVNQQWQFPEGCEYGKDKETPPKAGELEAIVDQVVAAAKAHQ